MKKHFMFMMAVLLGLIISMGSCNNSKKSSDDDDDDEKTEKKKGKKKNKEDKDYEDDDEWEYDEDEDDDDDDSYRTSSYDDDDDDEDFTLQDLKGMDINSLTSSQANKVLKIVCDNSDDLFKNEETPMSMRVRGNDVVIHAELDFASQGITVDQFREALQMPSMRQQLVTSMVMSAGEEGKLVFTLFAKANKDLLIEFEDANTGGTATCRITKSELAELGR